MKKRIFTESFKKLEKKFIKQKKLYGDLGEAMVWVLFFACVLACIVYVYLPGFFILRACYCSRFISLVSAPLVSIAGYGIIALILGAIGVFVNWVILFFSLGILAFIAFLYATRHKKKRTVVFLHNETKRTWFHVLLYVGFGLAITGWVYIITLDGPDSFIPGNDYTTHLNTIQSFIDSGNWSTLAGSYYPRGWAELATMVAQSFSVSAPFASNVVNSVIVSVVYPLSMLGFMTHCFKDHPLIVSCGSICVLAFTAFPWNVLTGSPIAPNVLGFSLTPIALLFVMLLLRDGAGKQARAICACVLVCFAVSCAFTHPNALYTAGVFAIPYCAYRILIYKNERIFPPNKIGITRRIAAILVLLLVVSAIWIGSYINPLFASIVNFNWPAVATAKQALVYTVTLSFIDMPAQWFAACMVILGIVYSFCQKRYLWITVSFLLFIGAYILNVSTDGFVKQLLTGFWYTASRRLSAAAVIMGVPLLAMGCFVVIRSIQVAFEYINRRKLGKVQNYLIAACFSLLFAIANYMPSFVVPGPTGQVVTSFGYLTDKFSAENAIEDNWILDKEERYFLSEVKKIVGEDVVINLPYDGSAFAYCLNQINIYYQHYSPKNDADSVILQTSLDAVAEDPQVSSALSNKDVHWLLILDYQGGEYDTVEFNREAWQGIVNVKDETPGFELVLSKDDMRLYKIKY